MRAFIIAGVFLVSGCAAAAPKQIDFPVNEGGKSVVTHRFFMDGFSEKDLRNQAFAAVTHNDLPGAKKLVEQAIAESPKDGWNHYDLAILYEASGEWDKAEAEVATAKKIQTEERFNEEARFISAHKGK